MISAIKTYLLGFKIKPFTSIGFCGSAIVVSSYTPDEGTLYEAFLHIEAVLVYLLLGMLLIKILLHRELDILFDIATLSILMTYCTHTI